MPKTATTPASASAAAVRQPSASMISCTPMGMSVKPARVPIVMTPTAKPRRRMNHLLTVTLAARLMMPAAMPRPAA